jgi:hypothetical protein
MKGLALIGLFWCVAIQAQHSMQTIVPLQPIAVGTAFQVQYIVTGNDAVTELQSPAFGRDFRFVSGPRLYEGEALINNKKVPVQNFSYTLIPLRKGRLIVKGATAVFASGKVKSDDTFVVVAEPAKEDPLASTPIAGLPRLAQGPTWEAQLQEQIFIKTAVSKTRCFVGEPVVATFTLFSRLPSASEIIKNPGFYGFSVLDMPDASDGGQTVQTHKGTFYNTHVLRKVQLYPAQSGNLVIDKMSVHNAIEYADSVSGKAVQTTIVLESEPITIAVKPLPATTLPDFTGAVGTFSINAYLEKEQWRENGNGKLKVRIKGNGNFVQLTAPDIHWPRGVDMFEPAASERLQKEAVPVSGMRTYTYTLTADSTGAYAIPPIGFTYFDLAAKKYKTIGTDSIYFTVLKASGKSVLRLSIRKRLPGSQSYVWWLAAVGVLAMGSMVIFWNYRIRRKPVATPRPERSPFPDFEKQVRDLSSTDAQAYRILQQSLMGVLKSWNPGAIIAAPGSLQQATAALPSGPQQELQAILEECEAVQYYNAAPTVPFNELQQRALHFMQSIKQLQAPERR